MHENRSRFTLYEYQKIIRGRYHKLGLVCENTATGSYKIFRPIPATPWVPEGRKKYFRKIRSRLDSINSNNRFTFCTLTYSTRFYNPVSASKNVKRDIDLFFKRLDYRNSRPEYFYVIELTDQLMVHVHLIFDRYVHKKKIFKSWNKITNSICIKIKHIPSQQAFYYCTKYLSDSIKQSDDKWSFIFKNIDRIWSSSRNFFNKNEGFKGLFSFYFMIWNKDSFLDQYMNKPTDLTAGRELSSDDTELLRYDADLRGCLLQRSGPVSARKLSKPALALPSQAQFSFFENSIYYS